MNKRGFRAAAILLLCAAAIILKQNSDNKWIGHQVYAAQGEEETAAVTGNGFYDSSDTALVVEKSEDSLTLYNLLKGRRYTLQVTGSTRLYDKYGSAISFSQLSTGEIAEVCFLKGTKELVSLQVSSQVWTLDHVNQFEVDYHTGRLKVMDEWYEIDEDTLIISNDEEAELLDIHEQDILRIQGTDHKIYSIVIEQGHGYLRLTNDEYFIGGWIEVGQRIIRPIEADMILPVPEGTYEVFLTNGEVEGSKEVVIERGQETELDVGDIRSGDLVKYGNLIFTVEPAGAQVFLDGKAIDVTRTIKTEYGLHQVMVKAEGYETVIQYIKVSQGSANVSIILDAEKERPALQNSSVSSNSGSVSSNSVSSNTTTGKGSASSSTDSGNKNTASTTGYKVNINAPQSAEVYVDGNYVGIIPTSFAKKAGSHVITIRKSGYQSRTYTVQIDEAQKDIDFSFSELIPISDTPVQEPPAKEPPVKEPSVSENGTISQNGTVSENGALNETVSGNGSVNSTVSGNQADEGAGKSDLINANP